MQPSPIKPAVDLSVLEQLDIRVGTIKGVDEVPGSDRLMPLRVNFGDHRRSVVAGIKLEP